MGCRQETGRCWPEFRAPCRSPCEMIWRGCFRLVLTTVSAYNDITQDGSTPLGLAEAFGSPGMLIGEAGAWRRWRSGVNMERACPLCGREYAVRSFGLDSGHCAECRPRFLSRPLWFAPTEAGRRSVWQFVLTIHVFYILLFLPLTCGAFELPRLALQLLCIGVFCRAVLRLRAQEAPHSDQGASDRVASLAGVWARRFPHALFLGSGAEIRHVGWASPALERMALAPCCRESGFRRGSLPPGSRQNDIL